ncbi:P-loop containing nucleoside triphosphate hydrolase protein [Irpex rosettiformis]|uniref:P-loop containing nucleoside triphosphate hydrolase protein n=1 Tax=Irpex rosettiformis TaxID=378272 RepID=A0ACB8U6F6_9APHY|nr:P-loop containing nucleoside triphosphate hydrolase protein [Irpex rosettiformis]
MTIVTVSVVLPNGDDSLKKKKKSKKQPKGVESADADIPSDAKQSKKRKREELVEVSADLTSEKSHKKDKKDKKKRKEQAEAVSEDTTDDRPSKKEKKEKRKQKLDQPAEEETPTSVEASEEPARKDKKDRKRKSKEALEEDVPSSSKKDKKDKKRKTEDVTTDTPVASSSRTVGSAPSSSEIEAFLTKNSITIHSASPITPIVAFDQLDVPDGLRAACSKFKEPTPIQACTWPPSLAGQDVVGIAETGSGKTLAFGLPALARILSSSIPQPQKGSSTVSVLVVAPTRELALQTHETLDALGESFGISSVAVFGGVPKYAQIEALRNISKEKGKKGKTTRIIVGTPGRILDLINDGVCDLGNVRYLVLDEADRMLDKGFENDIRSIIGHTRQGEERQTLMFSATWPDAVRRLAASFQRDPVRVTVGSDDLTANSRVEQVVEVFDDSRSKDGRLLGHLKNLIPKKKVGAEETRILIFALYKKEADRVESMLRSKGFSVGGLHGDLSQNARLEALQNFKTGKTGLLVATDVAARGLDIPNVAAVINYTFPLTIEDYIHRIGRTGRGGKSGKSITFFTGDAHERALAGELARILRESGFSCEDLKKFPMTIKKKTHSAYGAFFRDDIPTPSAPTKIKFD